MEAKKYRLTLSSFDFIKGIAIITVILAHMSSYYNLQEMTVLHPLYGVLKMMINGIIPMFFIISGFGFKSKEPMKMLKKSFSELIIPYLWVMVGYAVVYPIVMGVLYKSWPNAVHETLRYVIAFLIGTPIEGKMLFGYTLRWCTAAWFFLAMFFAFNILNRIVRIKNAKMQAMLVLFCVVLGYLLMRWEPTSYCYYCIPQGLMSVGLCYIGYILKKYRLFEQMLDHKLVYVILVPIAIAEGIWGCFALATATFNHIVLDYIGASFAGVLFMLLGFHLGRQEWKVLEGIKKVGVYTYWILAIHSVDMLALPWTAWSAVMVEHQLTAFILEFALRAVIITVVCILLKKITKYKYKRRTLQHAR